MQLMAACCAGLAVSLLLPRHPRVARPHRPVPLLLGVAAPVAGAVLVAGVSPRLLMLITICAGAAIGASLLVRARRGRRKAQETCSRVLECCEQVASELAAGQPPGAVLDAGARDWALLAPVAAAFRIGADVPDALREAAQTPGARDLRFVAAAWQVTHRTGHGLADAIDRVATELRATHATRRIVEGELASARATSRLVAGLPVLALAMGSGAGGDPWAFVLTNPVGLACLGVGGLLLLAGLAWIEAIARDVDRSS